MKKQTNDDLQRECASVAGKRQLERALRLLSGKWKSEILYNLVGGKLRFGQLRRAIPGVTQHMLTTQLRDLENEGLLKRTVFPEVPPRVEYEMTPAAKALRPVFDELFQWSQNHMTPREPDADDRPHNADAPPRISGDDRLP